MREIRFRSYDTFNDYYRHSDRYQHLAAFFELCQNDIDGGNELIFEQWTGLKDRHGVDIYEGDVCVRTAHSSKPYADSKPQKGEIIFSINRSAFIFSYGNRWSDLDATIGNEIGHYDERIEITGNIHQTEKKGEGV